MSLVDVRDIAEAGCALLVRGGFDDEVVAIVGPEVHTGETVAQVWSEALSRPVAYLGDDPEDYERNHRFNPPYLRFAYGLMFDFYQRYGLVATDEELERQAPLLAGPPRTLSAFAAETAAELATA
jgi:uncharacterized protein YbjT (DUF2867 family)